MADNDILRWKQVQTFWGKIKTWVNSQGFMKSLPSNVMLYRTDKKDFSRIAVNNFTAYDETQNCPANRASAVQDANWYYITGAAVKNYVNAYLYTKAQIDAKGYLTSISDNSITTEKLADGAVTADKIAKRTITADRLKKYTITNDELADDCISEECLQTASVTWAKMDVDSIGTGELRTDAVTSAKIADQSVTSAKLALGAVKSYPIWNDQTLKPNCIYTYVQKGVLTMPSTGESGDSIFVMNGSGLSPQLKIADNTVLTFPAGSSLVFNYTTKWQYNAVLPSTAPTTPKMAKTDANGYSWLTQSSFNYFEGVTTDTLKLVLPTGFEGQYVDVLLNNATPINVSIGLNTAATKQTVITASKTTGLSLRLIYVGGTWKICYNNTNTVDASKPTEAKDEAKRYEWLNFTKYQGETLTAEAGKEYFISNSFGSVSMVQLPKTGKEGDMVVIHNFSASTFTLVGKTSTSTKECPQSRNIYCLWTRGFNGWTVYYSDQEELKSRTAI